MDTLPPTNPPSPDSNEKPVVAPGSQDQESCLVSWDNLPAFFEGHPDVGSLTPSEPSPADGPVQPEQGDTLDQFVETQLREIDPEWTTGQLEAFINAFFAQLANFHASELAVNEVIKELHRTLKFQRGTAPTLPKLRHMYEIVAAA